MGGPSDRRRPARSWQSPRRCFRATKSCKSRRALRSRHAGSTSTNMHQSHPGPPSRPGLGRLPMATRTGHALARLIRNPSLPVQFLSARAGWLHPRARLRASWRSATELRSNAHVTPEPRVTTGEGALRAAGEADVRPQPNNGPRVGGVPRSSFTKSLVQEVEEVSRPLSYPRRSRHMDHPRDSQHFSIKAAAAASMCRRLFLQWRAVQTTCLGLVRGAFRCTFPQKRRPLKTHVAVRHLRFPRVAFRRARDQPAFRHRKPAARRAGSTRG